MLPITRARHIQNPSCRGALSGLADVGFMLMWVLRVLPGS